MNIQNKPVPVIDVEKVSKIYGSGETAVTAVNSVSVKIYQGEFTAIIGPSGSGKSTLLNIIGGLDIPSSGSVLLSGKSISAMTGRELSDFRRDRIGFVFQSYNLIPVLNVAENVEYIMLLQGIGSAERRHRVMEMLEEVGLGDKAERKPNQLSGGQQQRAAIARAMVSKPDIILADEPTANLDSASGIALVEMMRAINEKRKVTFVFSTHDYKIIERAKRMITLRDGAVVEDGKRETVDGRR